jgi:pyruvate kinase
MPFISPQDEKDLKFGCEHDMDAIFASFTRRPEDIWDIKAILKKYGKPNIPVFAKIENPEAVTKIEEIVKAADGIMVARGDSASRSRRSKFRSSKPRSSNSAANAVSRSSPRPRCSIR